MEIIVGVADFTLADTFHLEPLDQARLVHTSNTTFAVARIVEQSLMVRSIISADTAFSLVDLHV